MDARLLAGIWLISLFINIIEPTSSVTIQDDYETKSTDNFKPAKPTDRFKRFAATYPIRNEYFNDPAMVKNRRTYRQADSDAITSIETTAMTESNTPSEQSESTEKYTSNSTEKYTSNSTEKYTSYSVATDMPSSSTGTYESSDSELTETKETKKVIPLMTTDKSNYLEVSESSKNDPNESTDLPIVNNNNDIKSSSDLNQATKPITSSTQPSVSLDNIGTVESPKQLSVVGISENDKHTERVMTLQPPKEQKYVWLKETIHNMLQASMLMRETEDYVIQLKRYDDLPVSEADNSEWTKYSRAVVESFVLDFCRNYPHYSATEQSIARWYKVEEYKSIFNTTLLHLQQKRYHTAVQFAAPVRRAADIYKAILDTPIGIVQSKCDRRMPHWMCFAEYVVRLADISETCEHIWYHAQVHLTVLQSIRDAKGAKDPVGEVIDELDSRLAKVEPNNDVSFLFDFIIKTLGDLVQKLKEPLLTQASLYSLIRQLQKEDKLNCLNIDEQGW